MQRRSQCRGALGLTERASICETCSRPWLGAPGRARGRPAEANITTALTPFFVACYTSSETTTCASPPALFL